MRGFRLFGRPRRNDPVELDDPHPIEKYGDDVHTGNAFADGFTLLSKADPDRAGTPPPVKGTKGTVPRGPDDSFEQ